MANPETIGRNKRFPLVEAFTVAIFLVGLGIWVCAFPAIALAFRVLVMPDPSDMILAVATVWLGASILGLVGLAMAVPLARRSRRLPKWFRIVTVVSPMAALLLGLGMFVASFFK
jgi:hypothetical protein